MEAEKSIKNAVANKVLPANVKSPPYDYDGREFELVSGLSEAFQIGRDNPEKAFPLYLRARDERSHKPNSGWNQLTRNRFENAMEEGCLSS